MKSIFKLFITLAVVGVLVSSCERDIVSEENLPISELDKTAYVFEGLKLSNNSSKSIEEGKLVYEKDYMAFADVMNKKPQILSINLPISFSEVMPLKLEKWEIFSDDFKIVNEEGNIVENEINGIFYHGVLADDENSIVSVSIFEDDLSIMVISDRDTYHLNKGKDGSLAMDRVSSGVFETNSLMQNLSCDHSVDNFFQLNEAGVPEFETSKAAKSGACTYETINIAYTIDPTFENYFGGFGNAVNYFTPRFASAKAIYDYWGIPIKLEGYFRKSIVAPQPNSQQHILGPTLNKLESKFTSGSNYWDVMGSVVVHPDWLDGTGLGNTAMCGSTAPICERGHNNGAGPGCGPFSVTALSVSSGSPNDHYFIYVLAHEFGHNFGIVDSGNNDIMDHSAGNQHFIAHGTYVDMYQAWVNCYYTCN